MAVEMIVPVIVKTVSDIVRVIFIFLVFISESVLITLAIVSIDPTQWGIMMGAAYTAMASAAALSLLLLIPRWPYWLSVKPMVVLNWLLAAMLVSMLLIPGFDPYAYVQGGSSDFYQTHVVVRAPLLFLGAGIVYLSLTQFLGFILRPWLTLRSMMTAISPGIIAAVELLLLDSNSPIIRFEG